MKLSFRDVVASALFSPVEEAVVLERRFSTEMGGQKRYEPIRLMLGRSLMERESPKPLADGQRNAKRTIRGRDLFGNDIDLWISLFLMEGSFGEKVRIENFRRAVEAHWARGSELLADEFEKAEGDVVKLAQSLANRLPEDGLAAATGAGIVAGGDVPGAVRLRIGPVSRKHPGGQPVDFVLNGAGSPHLVLMGKTGTGKTRLGVDLIKQILRAARLPFIYIDPKPDFAKGCQYDNAFADVATAKTLKVGNEPIPLDFLPKADSGDIALQAACMRLRDSLCRPASAAKPIQRERLLSCVEEVARAAKERSLARIAEAYDAAMEQESDIISSVLHELTRFRPFEPSLPPEEFFSQSWVLSLSPAIPQSYQNLIMELLLDAEAAYWKSRQDAPLQEGHRELRHLLVIDEANRVIKNRSESLVEMITQTRQRGCVLMLLSQNPGDFASGNYEYITQIGAVISFACNQSEKGLTPLKGIFGRKLMPKEFSDSKLSPGLAFCKLPGRDPEVIQCFEDKR